MRNSKTVEDLFLGVFLFYKMTKNYKIWIVILAKLLELL